jgi:hypothetical protein
MHTTLVCLAAIIVLLALCALAMGEEDALAGDDE